MKTINLILITIIAVSISACVNTNETNTKPDVFSATPYTIPDIQYFPKNLNVPEDNPMSYEGIELGKYLFYDGRLSGSSHKDSLMSCGTCHIQENAFECGLDNPSFTNGRTHGRPSVEYPEGKPTPHYMMPIFNLVYNNNGYLWNGFVDENNEMTGNEDYNVPAEDAYHFKNIESLVWMSITAPHEMNSTIERSVNMISELDMYKPMFKKAFGTEEVTYDRISKAIAQFIRSIISSNSRFHQFIRKEDELSESEMRGHNLFFSEDADCFHCHAGSILMTNNEYFNNAKDTQFADKKDRYSVSGDPMDIGAYRAPTLLNIELTAPYMHDGRFKTLDEVIDFYSEGLVYSDFTHPLMKYVRDNGVQMSPQEKEDLKAFLLTLTDHQLINDPQYACPPELIEWTGR